MYIVSTLTEHTDDAAMQLLAEGLPLSLLWDLVDPAGPDSADLLAHEGGITLIALPTGSSAS